MIVEAGRQRVVIESVSPEIDGGRFPIKRVVGEDVVVEADIFSDSHDVISCALLYGRDGESSRQSAPMSFIGNDRWRGSFQVTQIGRYRYTVQAWVNRFGTWRRDLMKKVDAGQDVSIDLLAGADLIERAASTSDPDRQAQLRAWSHRLKSAGSLSEKVETALDETLAAHMESCADTRFATNYPKDLVVVVDREKARFSTWYEMFPRSCPGKQGAHGTFRDCEARLPDIAHMGFDVLYLPPIHPIGVTHRKGKNNSALAGPDDPGSPWAIGSEEGGHKAVHSQLGTLDDFGRLVSKAERYGIEIALDMAFQCSPDHPYVRKHRDWFRTRADGSIQYAENPPKKYEDILPLDFETESWRELWEALKGVVTFWIGQGVRIFRVDNPHTKPFLFWEWLISEVKKDHPDVLFLSEAFTRPKVMYRLAKLGFTQSYTYFAWRNTSWQITQYLTELTQGGVREFFRPNLWPNTPDILTEYLQMGGRSAFVIRLVLAATLGANYGIYGPAFELCENTPLEMGSEEYADSEKYEIRTWHVNRPESLKDLIARVNRIRRENPALQSDWSLRFHRSDNDQLLCFTKMTQDLSNILLVVVNLDPHYTHGGWIDLPLDGLGLDSEEPYQVHDLLGDARYLWQGPRNYLAVDPRVVPAHIFRIRRRVRTERDFDYFM